MKFEIKIKFYAKVFLTILIFLGGVGVAEAAYETEGVMESENYFPTPGLSLVNSFDYSVTIPGGTTAKAQFSYDGRVWYSTAGVLGAWDTLSTGSQSLDLSTLGWQKGQLYYRLWLTSDGSATPVFSSVSVTYTPLGGAYYVYELNGTSTSANLLPSSGVEEISRFDYSVSSLPPETSLRLQFSRDEVDWYNSAGTLDGYDTLTAGDHYLNLSGLGWSGGAFYYRAIFTSDGEFTPILDSVGLRYNRDLLLKLKGLLLFKGKFQFR
ncbi:MAG: hypothetical protein COV08_01350 [Candidatus Vogelbacteria bacterium CG10_big_fil_rev_8_21_14_0_10_49_38]|uniref:Uncharacterized protein n=1 Tax=Candidatus Vogelbacteria bacterium CG10_big_fil_rev_8_21_14_0_10_49_38 TaxID=1975043 RepID=A0A2H0RI99_9BACT|nr:MAG: hypothetical protein BK006_01370 [bacterium CG10_49_38]PIR46136.1 MAG: hypothetical protein COV08_01350 [Candidatus Vogelbacteria bacterium CG10_big_fil_rev_8_21_14_0_10_49_38]